MAQCTKYLYKITATWAENTVNWNTKPATSSTQITTCTNTKTPAWEDFDVTNTVKEMLASPSTNYGFLFKCKETTSDMGITMRSSESSQTTYRPKLTVVYEGGSGILPQKMFGSITPAKEYKIAVFNLQGKEIASHTIKNISTLKKMLPAGVNIVKINDQKVKIVKQQ